MPVQPFISLADANARVVGAAPARCRLPRVAGLVALPALLAIAAFCAVRAYSRGGITGGNRRASPALAEQAYQQSSDAGDNFVEQTMAPLPGILDLQMNVQMLGMERNGSHVLGHLVKVDNPIGRVSLALPPGGCGTREKTTITAQKHSPRCRLAVNAGYFNVTNGACIGNLVSDGVVIQTVPLAQSNVNFGIRGGKFAIGYFTQEQLQDFEQLVSGVTWLVRDGKSYVQQGWREANTTVQTSGDKYATNLASRTAVGVDKDGRLIILQIDGSIAVGHLKRGLNMFQLADLLIENGAVHAINLDGGGSSAMARDGVLINYPSDMRPPSCDASGKHQCERPVSTILCVHELPEVEERPAGQTSDSSGLLAGVALLVFAAGCASAFGLIVLFPNLVLGGKSRKMARQISRESAISESAVSGTSGA